VRLRSLDIDLSVQPVRDGAGEVVFAVVSAQDVTSRKRAELELRESERWLRRSQEIARIGHYVYDVGTNTWTGSEMLDSLFGIDGRFPRTAAGWLGIVHPEDRATMQAYLGEILADGSRFDREYRVVDQASGETRWVHGLGELQRGPGGESLQLVGTIQDITARRRAADELRQAQKLESIGRLAGGIAHDFNNLLTVILSCGEEASQELGRGSVPEPGLVEDIVAAARRASGLTRQLLAFARKQTFAPELVDLNEILRSSGKLLGRLRGEDVRIVEELQPDAWTVRCDPVQVGQVVMNLAVNARDAMPAGGTLTVSTDNLEVGAEGPRPIDNMPPGQYLRLTVRDTGKGMSPETMEHLFEPFFTTKPPGTGTGLGLSTVYGILKQAGAHVAVDSAPGRGSTFAIHFPRAKDGEAGQATRAGRRPGGIETVLVVEDDRKVREVTVRALESAGYRVLAAGGGYEALQLVRGEPGPIHLVLTDVVMPGIGGREIARQVLEWRTEASVLFMSGYPHDAIDREGVLDEGIEFLQKPFTASTLLDRVRTLIDRSRSR
jgi:PAS domain S-box-containing protein